MIRTKVDPKRIVELVKQGNTAGQIQKRLGASRSAVWRAIRNAAAQPKG
jgi:DNA-binding CsgD family transcriptional regulator